MSKKTIVQAIVCIGLVVMIWGGYFFAKNRNDRIIEVKDDDFSWVYQVDSAEIEGKSFVLQGFAFQFNRVMEEEKYEIVLQDVVSGKKYFPEMTYFDRIDVRDYFLCEYDYLKSGFKATFKEKRLFLQERDYEVLLRVKGEKTAYRTGTFLSKGELAYAKPTEFEPLDVAGTDLEDVVGNGVLRVYRPDVGMYVYQHEGELYWIAEPEYGFVDEDTYVQYQFDTTQIDKLPQDRLDNRLYWGYMGFLFSARELTDWDTGAYRVAKRELSKECSVTKIWTGNHIEGWIWRQDFRPYYQFGER